METIYPLSEELENLTERNGKCHQGRNTQPSIRVDMEPIVDDERAREYRSTKRTPNRNIAAPTIRRCRSGVATAARRAAGGNRPNSKIIAVNVRNAIVKE